VENPKIHHPTATSYWVLRKFSRRIFHHSNLNFIADASIGVLNSNWNKLIKKIKNSSKE